MIDNITNNLIQVHAGGADISIWILVLILAAAFIILSLKLQDYNIGGVISALISISLAMMDYISSQVISTGTTYVGFIINNTTIIQPVQTLVGASWIGTVCIIFVVAGVCCIVYHIWIATSESGT